MPRLFIQTRNAEFFARDDGAEYDQPEVALIAGVQSAVDMAADEIASGRSAAAVVITVQKEDGTALLSSVVTVSVAPLTVAQPSMSETD